MAKISISQKIPLPSDFSFKNYFYPEILGRQHAVCAEISTKTYNSSKIEGFNGFPLKIRSYRLKERVYKLYNCIRILVGFIVSKRFRLYEIRSVRIHYSVWQFIS